MQKKLKIFLIIAIPFFVIVHYLGCWKYYYYIEGYDKLVHVLAGASVVLAVYWFLEERAIKVNKQLISLIALLFITFCWEVYEYLIDNVISPYFILTPRQMGPIDTLADTLAAFAGAIIILIWFYLKERNRG
ncbi:hypothetical protein KKG58_02030 [Patescibacteria group bacterium]|nr:hypothetical protein [Patescibacteria group bacterium]